jgi:hypothetical protein
MTHLLTLDPNDPYPVVNVLRLAVMASMGALCVLALIVVVKYTSVVLYRGYRGVLPVHVLLIGLSYLMAVHVAGDSLWVLYKRDDPMTWRVLECGALVVFGITALVLVLRHVRNIEAAAPPGTAPAAGGGAGE